MNSLFTLNNLQISSPDRVLCEKLNLSIEAGQCWGILGCNGSGKTTLLNTLAGLQEADTGELRVCGKPIEEYDSLELARLMGYLLQTMPDDFPQSVFEFCSTGLHPHKNRWQIVTKSDHQALSKILKQVDLANFETRSINSLSGGEKRRVEIANLLAQNPRIWLLDEPVNHLDIAHQLSMLELIIKQATSVNGAVISVLHDANLVERFCSHVLMIFKDGTYLAGDKSKLLNATNLSELFGVRMFEMQQENSRAFLPA